MRRASCLPSRRSRAAEIASPAALFCQSGAHDDHRDVQIRCRRLLGQASRLGRVMMSHIGNHPSLHAISTDARMGNALNNGNDPLRRNIEHFRDPHLGLSC